MLSMVLLSVGFLHVAEIADKLAAFRNIVYIASCTSCTYLHYLQEERRWVVAHLSLRNKDLTWVLRTILTGIYVILCHYLLVCLAPTTLPFLFLNIVFFYSFLANCLLQLCPCIICHICVPLVQYGTQSSELAAAYVQTYSPHIIHNKINWHCDLLALIYLMATLKL